MYLRKLYKILFIFLISIPTVHATPFSFPPPVGNTAAPQTFDDGETGSVNATSTLIIPNGTCVYSGNFKWHYTEVIFREYITSDDNFCAYGHRLNG